MSETNGTATATPTRKTKPRSRTAPKVKPMFSDSAEQPPEEVDPVGEPAPQEEVATTVDGKERRMKIQAHAVPGKAALATLTPDALKDLAFISTYNTVDDQSTSPRQHGYQRDPLVARFPAIGRYYATEEEGERRNAHLITPIIASVRVYTEKDQEDFNRMLDAGDIDGIHKKFGKSVVSIVDGQHRMGGLFWAWERDPEFNPDVPVMLYYGLRYTDEAKLFDTVNSTQRKLPKALIEVTKQHLDADEDSHAQTIRNVAFALAQDGDSVWYDKVNMTGARDPQRRITYEGLRRATGNMLHERLIARLNSRGIPLDRVAKRYWEMVARTSAPAWQGRPRVVTDPDTGNKVEEPVQYRLTDLAGVASVSRLGADIISTSLEQSRTEEDFWSAMASLVSKLGQIDWEKRPGNPWTSAGAGFAGLTGLYRMLFDLVYLDKAPGVAVESTDE